MLTVRDLHKRYGRTEALRGVSLTVAPGEMVGFVGANGAGKSTTMRIAMGLLAADSGTIEWDGRPADFAVRRRFGYMPEERGLYPKMRIAEQIAYLGRLRGMSVVDARAAAGRLIERMQVAAQPTDALQSLSLGNQQRIQLAAALVHDPVLLILDEPYSGLDPVAVDTMAGVLAERTAAGVGVLFSSHQLELVERYCDRVIIVRSGRIVAAGTLAQLRAGAPKERLEIEVSGAAAGWLHGLAGVTVVASDGDRHVLHLDDPGADQQVLHAAVAAGRVERFGWLQPSLGELYRDAISAPEPEEAS